MLTDGAELERKQSWNKYKSFVIFLGSEHAAQGGGLLLFLSAKNRKEIFGLSGSLIAKMTLRLEGKRTRWNKFYGGVNLKGTGAARSSRGARRSHFSARERGAVGGRVRLDWS